MGQAGFGNSRSQDHEHREQYLAETGDHAQSDLADFPGLVGDARAQQYCPATTVVAGQYCWAPSNKVGSPLQRELDKDKLPLVMRAVSFVLALLALAGCTSGQSPLPTPTAGAVCTNPPSSPVTLTMYYGSEKQAWIEDVVKVFNAACAGSITVKATPLGSGQSMQMILNGDKPDIWSPAGSVWLALMNQQWQAKHGTNIIATGPTDTPSLVTSPVVIGMWKLRR